MVPLVSMAENEALKRYIEAGIAFTEATRARAEEFVKDLARSGEIQWDQVQSQVDELVDWSKRNTDELLGTIRDEVAAPLSLLSQTTKDRLEAWERRFEETFKDGFAIMATWRRAHREEPSERGHRGPGGPQPMAITAVVDGPEGYPAPPAASQARSGRRRFARGRGSSAATAEKAPAKKAPTKRAPAKKVAGRELSGFAGGSDARSREEDGGPRRRLPPTKRPAKKTAAKKAAAKKAPAKKTPAKKTAGQAGAAKKTPAKKTAAKKVPAAKTPAKKAATRRLTTSGAPSTDGPSSAASGPASGDRKE